MEEYHKRSQWKLLTHVEMIQQKDRFWREYTSNKQTPKWAWTLGMSGILLRFPESLSVLKMGWVRKQVAYISVCESMYECMYWCIFYLYVSVYLHEYIKECLMMRPKVYYSYRYVYINPWQKKTLSYIPVLIHRDILRRISLSLTTRVYTWVTDDMSNT